MTRCPGRTNGDYRIARECADCLRRLTMGLQPWTAMEAWMTREQFIGFLRGNLLKYSARAGAKGPMVDDIRKAAHYAQKLIEVLEQPE